MRIKRINESSILRPSLLNLHLLAHLVTREEKDRESERRLSRGTKEGGETEVEARESSDEAEASSDVGPDINAHTELANSEEEELHHDAEED